MPDPKKAAYDEKAYLSPFSVITSQRKRKEATSWARGFFLVKIIIHHFIQSHIQSLKSRLGRLTGGIRIAPGHMIIDDPDGLQIRINNRCADKSHPPLFQIITDPITQR